MNPKEVIRRFLQKQLQLRNLQHLGRNPDIALSAKLLCPENIRVNDKVHIGPKCQLFGQGGISVLDFAILAPEVVIFSSQHNYKTNDYLPYGFSDSYAPVSIGVASWIGFRSVILPGVTVGDYAIIGACSVVTRDVPRGAIVAGNPAKIIATRSAEVLNRLEEEGAFYMAHKSATAKGPRP